MRENPKLAKVRQELLNGYRDLAEVNRQIAEGRKNPDMGELTLLTARRSAMFEVLSYLRTRALPEAVQESLIEERKSLPQTINALKVSISSRKRELRQAVEASFPDIAEALFVLGAKWQGTTAITLPDGFQKPAREAHGRAHNGEIGKMSSEIVQLEARLNSPVDPSNKAESVGHQVMTEAMAKHGFDFTRDWLEPFFRGQ